MKQYIYKITIKTTNKSYIGTTNNPERRLAQHKCCVKQNYEGRKSFYKDWSIENIDNNYSFEILEEFEFTTKRDNYDREVSYIKLYNTYNNGYNVCEYSSRNHIGPNKGKKLNEKWRKHISENHWNRNGTWINNPASILYKIQDNNGIIYNCSGRTEICEKLYISLKQAKMLISKKDTWYTPRNHNKDKRSFMLLNKIKINK